MTAPTLNLRSVACPQCGVKPGNRCRTVQGRQLLDRVHVVREAAARRRSEGLPEETEPAKRPKLKVWEVDEDGWVVRGTRDVEVARAALARHRADDCYLLVADATGAAALYSATPGLYRWNPCSPSSCYDGGGHCGHLARAEERVAGVWQGVHFR